MTICERIFDIIDHKNLKTADLARKLNVQQSVISNWKKRNTNPPIEYALVICEFIGVSIEYLITGENNGNLKLYEKEMLKYYRQLPEQEQIRELGRLEAKAEQYQEMVQEKSSSCRTG